MGYAPLKEVVGVFIAFSCAASPNECPARRSDGTTQAFFWRRLKRYKNNSLPFCHCANGLFSLKPELFNAIALPHL
jgi:hypothetical protein